MFRTFLKRSEKYFQKGTKQQFWLHEVLLISNIFLFSLAIFEFYAEFTDSHVPHWLHMAEFIFGILFLVELILYLVHVYFPNKVFYKPHLVLNAIVIASLIHPPIFGNLAILRLIRSFKIVKVYMYRKKVKNDLEENPELEMQTVKLAKNIGKKVEAARERIFLKS